RPPSPLRPTCSLMTTPKARSGEVAPGSPQERATDKNRLPEPAAGCFEGQAFVFPIRVYYEDTDFSGVVYHASYLRFMERGRSNYLRLLGADQRAVFGAGAQEAPGFAFV